MMRIKNIKLERWGLWWEVKEVNNQPLSWRVLIDKYFGVEEKVRQVAVEFLSKPTLGHQTLAGEKVEVWGVIGFHVSIRKEI